MTKTPVQVESVKSNPFIGKSISKSLLTPCRQVGLSRKRKTPSSTNSTTFEDSANRSLNADLDTTPLSSSSFLSVSQGESSVNKSDQTEGVNPKKKPRVSKRLLADDELESLNLENVGKKQCSVILRNVLEVKESLDEATSVEEKGSFIPKLRDASETSSRKSQQKKFSSDEEDMFHEHETFKRKVVQAECVVSPKAKKGIKTKKSRLTPRKKSKIVMVASDEDDNKDIEEIQQSEMKLRKSPRKVRRILNEDEAFVFNKSCKNTGDGGEISGKKEEKLSVVEAVSKTKKIIGTRNAKSTPRKDKKIAMISSDDETDFKTSNETQESNKSQKNYEKVNVQDSLKSNEVKIPQKQGTETEVKLTNDEKTVHNESVTILQDVTNNEYSQSPVKPFIADHNYYTKPNSKTKKIKRSLSLKKSSEEKDEQENLAFIDCLSVLTPSRVPSAEDIQKLEKHIKEKRKILDDLKQADIYQKKHSVEELQELTSRWKTGCISALKDLLPQLQSHASIDMATLLKNLNIPQEMVTLTENGDLI